MATKEETKRMIEVMQAFVDGKEIQARHEASLEWQPSISPIWNFDHYDYRVKEDMELKAWNTYLKGGGCDSYHMLDNQPVRKGMRAIIDAVKRGEIE